MSWRYGYHLDDTDDVHVSPEDDVVEHVAEDCICGPRTEPLKRDDGSIDWMIVHHSLDGRERLEVDA